MRKQNKHIVHETDVFFMFIHLNRVTIVNTIFSQHRLLFSGEIVFFYASIHSKSILGVKYCKM